MTFNYYEIIIIILLEEKCKEYTKMISTKSFQELEYDEIEEDCAEINI